VVFSFYAYLFKTYLIFLKYILSHLFEIKLMILYFWRSSRPQWISQQLCAYGKTWRCHLPCFTGSIFRN